MSRFTLSRRAILQGTGCAGMALPFLEILNEGRARAAKAPPKYVVMYAGVSLTRDNSPTPNLWWPKTPGENYEIPRDLNPLGRNSFNNGHVTFGGYDVPRDVSIVTGLKIPYVLDKGQALPRAGKGPDFHGYTMNPLLCGMTASYPDAHSTPSSDQIVASSPGVTYGTKFASLQYGVQ